MYPTLFIVHIVVRTYTEVAQYVCNQLNLPLSTIRYVCPDEGSEQTTANTGLEMFQSALEEDKAAGKTPLMCVANVHSSIFQKQSVSRLQVCDIVESAGTA